MISRRPGDYLVTTLGPAYPVLVGRRGVGCAVVHAWLAPRNGAVRDRLRNEKVVGSIPTGGSNLGPSPAQTRLESPSAVRVSSYWATAATILPSTCANGFVIAMGGDGRLAASFLDAAMRVGRNVLASVGTQAGSNTRCWVRPPRPVAAEGWFTRVKRNSEIGADRTVLSSVTRDDAALRPPPPHDPPHPLAAPARPRRRETRVSPTTHTRAAPAASRLDPTPATPRVTPPQLSRSGSTPGRR
jgi:hypothetical protein